MIAPLSEVQVVLDLVGIFVFALSGGLVGVRARLDLFGVVVLAWVTGVGGGILRDVFLGDLPPVGLSDPLFVLTALTAGLLTFSLHARYVDLSASRPQLRLSRIGQAVKYLDAVGLATFAVAGAAKAIDLGAPPLACILIGGIAAVGGGAIRDVLVGRVPEVLRREVYALAALLGASVVVLADQLDLLTGPVLVGAALLTLGVRVAAILLDLNVPTTRIPTQSSTHAPTQSSTHAPTPSPTSEET